MPPKVELFVNGAIYDGWQTAHVVRSIETVSGSFDLTHSDRWSGRDDPWPIREGDRCTLTVGGEVLITGYVDRRGLSYDAGSRSLRVAGRDKTGDLVDCSAKLGRLEFAKQRVDKIVAEICAPYGVAVSMQSGLGLAETRDKFAVNYGDGAFDVIERACRLAGVLAMADGQGGLLLTRTPAGRCSTALVEGENILSASGDFDASGRYRDYLVAAQQPGSDDDFGETVAHVEAKAQDGNARTGRFLIVQVEGNATVKQAQDRANWEGAVRAARAGRVQVTVQGWTQTDGVLWPLNALVNLRAPWLGIDGDMLIAGLDFSLDLQGGTTTTFDLARPDAFLPEPVIPEGSDSGGFDFGEDVGP